MEPREPAKAAFHWALAGVLVPGIGLVAAPVLAAAFRGGAWGRRLAILAVVDLLVLAAFVPLARRADDWPAPMPEGPRIGVLFEEGGTTVKSVVEGWPAADAGLRPGDAIRAVDGAAPTSQAELIRTLRERESERVLTVERAGTSMEVRVTPRRPQVRERGLFEAADPSWSLSFRRNEIVGYGVAAAAVLAAWLASRRRPRPRVWRGFFLALAFFIAGSLGAPLLVQFVQGGMSRGGLLISLILGHAALALGGLLASRWLAADRPPEPPAALGTARALVRALYYTVTVYPRAGILLLAADLSLFDGAGKPPDALESFATTLHGPLGVSLFVLAVAVVGPIAEELVFRGLLLPRLAARIGRGWALAATSVIFGCMHANYGLYAVLTAVLGWTLGWARLSSGGLAAPIALHMILNGAVTAVFFLR